MPSFQQHPHQHHQQIDDYQLSDDRNDSNIKMENMATDLRKLD